jgi:hypothetical protein
MKRRLTKQDRAQCISLLKAAKKRLRMRYDTFICYALTDAALVGFDLSNEMVRNVSYLREWVSKCLGSTSIYESWVAKFYPTLWLNATDDEQVYQPYVARCAWIDWMVNELEAGR